MTVREQVIGIVAEHFGRPESEVKDEHDFGADYGADSLDLVELVLKVEEVFDITIPDDISDHLKKVENVVAYCENMVAAKSR